MQKFASDPRLANPLRRYAAKKVPDSPYIRALVVDDEQLARDELRFLLKAHPEVEVVAEASNGLEALKAIDDLEPDLVFLDVQMPGLDGLGVARKVLERGGEVPHFVFATAFDRYAVDAFEVDAADYLLKPIEKSRLARAVDRALARMEVPEAAPSSQFEELLSRLQGTQRAPSKVLVNFNGRLVLVDAAEVIFASIERSQITVVGTDVQGLSNYKTLEELQTDLDPQTFWRAHRSYLVNINRIKEVEPWFKSSYRLRMSDSSETEIPVSRAQTKRLRELFKL